MTGNGNHTTYQHGDDWGMVNMALFYPHKKMMSVTQYDAMQIFLICAMVKTWYVYLVAHPT